ncbi:hypothetical protein JRQ81_017471 [Phrynocephalus forsythii]|uniref:Death domain-containing protein n=1 Tax=Phrynocephalus forsythii TaxID=171643 RepID=A0A9Q0XQF3_9SAUR|nr:hypothetical protein JRQ81_017471 [Phrynocephalus forsythii]
MGGAGGGAGGFGSGGGGNPWHSSGYNPYNSSIYLSGTQPVGGYQGGRGIHMPRTAVLEEGEQQLSEDKRTGLVEEKSYLELLQHAQECSAWMLMLARHSAQALLDYAVTADPRMLLAVQRHLAASQDENGDTPLHLAVIHEQTAVISQLVQVAVSIPNQRILNITNHLQQTPLHLAVITRQPRVAGFLLQAGADPTLLDRYGNSILHLALQLDDEETLKILLCHLGPHTLHLLETPNYLGLFPVHLAVKHKKPASLELLVEKGADVNAAERQSGRTPLHLAVEMENLHLATCLMKKLGADVNAKTSAGNTPLHLAAGMGSPILTKMLIKAGADVLCENDEPIVSSSSSSSNSSSDTEVDQEEGETEWGMELGDTCSCQLAAGGVTELESSHARACGLKRSRGHTPLDMASTQKVRDILLRASQLGPEREGPAAGPPAASGQRSILSLNTDTFQSLEQLLNRDCRGADWAELAKRLGLCSLVETYKDTPSPSRGLLLGYELAGGSLKGLLEALDSMGLMEGVRLLQRAETFVKLQNAEVKEDSAYGSQSAEEEPAATAGKLQPAPFLEPPSASPHSQQEQVH